METGLLALVLHAHLPYVRHPEYAEFLEEDWFYEALSECYIPLLNIFTRLLEQDVNYRITLTLTPTLVEMFADRLLQERYERHLDRLIELCEKEVRRTRHEPAFHATAQMYLGRLTHTRHLFVNRYQRNVARGFKALQDAGTVEIMTCGATHGFLPLIIRPEARLAQIEIGRANYRKHFGRNPRGIWLPECAYEHGLEELLKAGGLEFFLVNSSSLLFGRPRPRCGIFAPVYTPSGVAAFARDVETSEQVWSSTTGYPGDYDYREFYRDLGYDADYEYILPYLHSDGVRRNTGIKYHRITGPVPLDQKLPYNPRVARERAAMHAANFIDNRQRQAEFLGPLLGRVPLVVSPYDAELFGHWWFEGPQFLDFLIRKLSFDQSAIRLITPPQYLAEFPANQTLVPAASTWGAEGYSRVWINDSNEWLYRHQHIAEDRMIELANTYPETEGLLRRALNQAARELLLAESSDWAFIITTGTMVAYAVKRFKDHIHRFTRCYEMIRQNQIDEVWLRDVEARDNIFAEIDYLVYRSSSDRIDS